MFQKIRTKLKVIMKCKKDEHEWQELYQRVLQASKSKKEIVMNVRRCKVCGVEDFERDD